MSEYFLEPTSSGGMVKVKLGLSNYATKVLKIQPNHKVVKQKQKQVFIFIFLLYFYHGQ